MPVFVGPYAYNDPFSFQIANASRHLAIMRSLRLLLKLLLLFHFSHLFRRRLHRHSLRYKKIKSIPVSDVLHRTSLPHPTHVLEKYNFHTCPTAWWTWRLLLACRPAFLALYQAADRVHQSDPLP